MTAIALLNSENDPHVVADTLLSADGPDPNKDKSIWLPALGHIHSEWENKNGKWYIPRLGRKTFAVPVSSGLLAFAGHCSSAFNFWDELSTHFYSRQAYDPNYSITKDIVENILSNNKNAYRFSLLGMVRNNNGKFLPLIHRPDAVIETKSYGVCYIAGSGSDMLKKIILERDKAIDNHNRPTKISHTEDLAEYISAEMLYNESDLKNGLIKGTPLDYYCGGFYEWYGIKDEGVKVLQPRIDMSVSLTDDGIVITRLYFSEQYMLPPSSNSSIYSFKYPISVVNLISDFKYIDYTSLLNEQISLSFSEVYGTYIDSTFFGYEGNPQFIPRLSGPIRGGIAERMFSSIVNVKRIRLFVNFGENTFCKGFVNPTITDSYVSIQYSDGKFTVSIADEIKYYILGKIFSLYG
ncbi:hypothetical protein DFO55_10173 [Grimontella sp. AG753]|nr:hypothetical protein DFO55_10173 [Grimontella sp. AG753]